MTILLLALLQNPSPPSVFEKPRYTEGEFKAAVDSGAHATAGAGNRGPIPPLGILRLTGHRPSASTNREANEAHAEAMRLAPAEPLKAAALLERAVELDPSPQHVLDAAVQLLAHGAPRRAASLLKAGVRQYPREATLWLTQGLAEYALARYEAARDSFLAARRESPSDPRTHDALALLIDVSPALADALAEDLAGAPLYQAQAMLRGSQPQYEEAERLLRRAAAEYPALDTPRFELARLYLERQQAEAARTELEATVKLNPDHELAHFRLAQLYQRARQSAEADRHFAIYRRLHAGRLEKEERERTSRLLFRDLPGPSP